MTEQTAREAALLEALRELVVDVRMTVIAKRADSTPIPALEEALSRVQPILTDPSPRAAALLAELDRLQRVANAVQVALLEVYCPECHRHMLHERHDDDCELGNALDAAREGA
ncbi:MAG TPA: hypothetical protein VF171_09195 [Trueperaceae bacterium]